MQYASDITTQTPIQYESLCRFLRYNPIRSARRMSTQVADTPIIANGLIDDDDDVDDVGRPPPFFTVRCDESIGGISTRNDSRATSVGRLSSDCLLASTASIWRRPRVNGRSWSHLALSLKNPKFNWHWIFDQREEQRSLPRNNRSAGYSQRLWRSSPFRRHFAFPETLWPWMWVDGRVGPRIRAEWDKHFAYSDSRSRMKWPDSLS